MLGKTILHEKGQALPLAIALVAITTLSVLFMMTRILGIEKDLRAPRIKAQQTIQKARINNALNLPLMYDCTKTISSTQTCTLDMTKLRSVLSAVQGADCGSSYSPVAGEIVPSSGCGFSLRPETPGQALLDYEARTVRAVIHYMGNETSIRDTPLTFNIPGQLLTGEITLCPSATPKFMGFDADGNAQCEAFSGNMSCAPGWFAESIDQKTFEVTCHQYVSGKSCGSGQFMSSLRYSSGSYTGSCSSRINPFIYYDFNPELSLSQSSFVPYGSWGASYTYYQVAYPEIVYPKNRTCNSSDYDWSRSY